MFLSSVSATFNSTWQVPVFIQMCKPRRIIKFSSNQPKSHSAPISLNWWGFRTQELSNFPLSRAVQRPSGLRRPPKGHVEPTVTGRLSTRLLLRHPSLHWPHNPFKFSITQRGTQKQASWEFHLVHMLHPVCSLITSPRGSR